MTALIVIALVMFVLGFGLLAWAYRNPKWQHAEAYGALLPVGLGLLCVGIALALGIGYWFAHLMQRMF